MKTITLTRLVILGKLIIENDILRFESWYIFISIPSTVLRMTLMIRVKTLSVIKACTATRIRQACCVIILSIGIYIPRFIGIH